MPETDFETPLDETNLEWMRVRFTNAGGQVVTFTIQYETTDNGRRVPVVRFDNAHGFPHRDVLNRRGQLVAKTRLPGDPPVNVALTIGQRDIQQNWQRYRRAFFGDDL